MTKTKEAVLVSLADVTFDVRLDWTRKQVNCLPLPSTHRQVLGVMCSRPTIRGWCYVGVEEVASKAGVSRYDVVRCLTELARRGYILAGKNGRWQVNIEKVIGNTKVEGREMATTAYVTLYKSSNNGEVLVETNATTLEEFYAALPEVLWHALNETPDDEAHTLIYALPAIVEIANKLQGYKNAVMEQRVLLSGSAWPDRERVLATNRRTSEELITA